jgi:hypothetical protein
MLMMHLSLEAAQHWHLIVQWLYVSSVIDKALMLSWAHLNEMKQWMQHDWSTRSPAKLFAKAAKGDKDIVIKRHASVESWDAKGTWLQHIPLSSKTTYIIQYVPSPLLSSNLLIINLPGRRKLPFQRSERLLSLGAIYVPLLFLCSSCTIM